ncbi:hypothetical protein HMPREF9444_00998 [Succinatimonas hippei YIT 12066]|uniref:Uncharacterized protein n=1 Tax=Succinatimonas hippei (strain DSM 22608 / JCM 16073 / KCTC 15190 / YIT 12066) TaxID=762983 RepID=E8LJW2_SUCHY|nr:hypothetical protein HMPREF9444_00998 [Succinatimonas hippei YIT 12066]
MVVKEEVFVSPLFYKISYPKSTCFYLKTNIPFSKKYDYFLI